MSRKSAVTPRHVVETYVLQIRFASGVLVSKSGFLFETLGFAMNGALSRPVKILARLVLIHS